MINHLRGILTEVNHTEIVVECNGVGYLMFVSLKTIEQLPAVNEEVKILSHFIPREDSHNLYGFFSATERDMFRLLISISGIGPKIALGILSAVTFDELVRFIASADILALTKLPGIGKKTAERVLVELKDRIKDIELSDHKPSATNNNSLANEAISALMALGYNKNTAEKCVNRVLKDIEGLEFSAELLIRNALKYAMS
jgi:Holliday junction DNA helicase RuvA